MSLRRELSRLRALFRRPKLADDLNVEIRSHLEIEERENLESGMPPDEAHYAALRRFGNVTLANERSREMWLWNTVETLLQDLRYGLRQLRRNPGFTAVAVIMLALGIGANTAIFTVFDAILLRPLPVRQPGRLVMLTNPNATGFSYGLEGGTRDLLGYPEFGYLRDHNSAFSGIFAMSSKLPSVPVHIGSSSAYSSDQVEIARVSLVSGGYFSTLGVNVAVGRAFGLSVDKTIGSSPYAVISYDYWKRRFGLNPSVVGKTIKIRKTLFTIIGVAPSGFSGITVGNAPDVWVPMTMQAAVYPGRDMLSPVAAMQNEYIWLQVIAKLKPGVTVAEAQANVNVLFQRLLESQVGPGVTATQRKSYLNQRIQIQSATRGVAPVRGAMGDPLIVLMGLVGIVLLIACANVANLLLARGSVRQREFAIRTAIGAGHARLIRQLLVESCLLACFGAATGVLLAGWASALLVRSMPVAARAANTFHLDLALDWRVLGFTLTITALTAVLFGLIPAWRAARVDLLSTLKSAAGMPSGNARSYRYAAGKLMVIGQLAASVILLVAAGLFTHSLARPR